MPSGTDEENRSEDERRCLEEKPERKSREEKNAEEEGFSVSMKIRSVFLTVVFLFFSAAFSCVADSEKTTAVAGHTTAHLFPEYSGIDGKSSFWILFQLDIQQGWHTYWKNPGDSGLAPSLKWKLPKGVHASPILWQPPQRHPLGPLVNYGYAEKAYHLVKIELPKSGLKEKLLSLHLSASWLVCQVECIPEKAELDIHIPVGSENITGRHTGVIQDLIRSASFPQKNISHITVTDEMLSVEFDSEDTSFTSAYIFPDHSGSIDSAAPQNVSFKNGAVEIRLVRGLVALPDVFEGILEITAPDGKKSWYSLSQQISSSPSAKNELRENVSSAAESTWWSFLLILLSAFIGGILLNAMPCVFPILSLKAFAISKKANMEQAEVRLQGLAYTAGVLTSFLAVGGLLLALKSAGSVIGWGYQMQSPLFVMLLIYLLFLVGLNLSGLFEISYSYGGGEQLVRKKSWLGSFATGVLATAVATPCTAPFMATAVGAALALPAFPALTVFLALGAGMAFPFFLISFIPAALRFLPRPGAWMEHFKQFLAFPMYLAVIWLLWILGVQIGHNAAMMVLVGLLSIVFVLWLLNMRTPSRRTSLSSRILSCAALLSCILIPGFLIWNAPRSIDVLSEDGNERTAMFSESALQKARAEKKDVFVYMTASWCITCKLNEQFALETTEVQQLFQQQNIHVLKGDWTNTDPAITAYLTRFGRAGVPLYVFYPSGGEPVLLPQLLTPGIIRERIYRQKPLT